MLYTPMPRSQTRTLHCSELVFGNLYASRSRIYYFEDHDRYTGNSVTKCDDMVAQHELGHAWDTLALQPTAIPLHLGGRNRDPAALRSC